MTTGESFLKMIKPVGAMLCILVSVLFIIMSFTSGKNPVPGYTPPNDSEYYSQHLSELEIELEQNLLPYLKGIENCYEDNGRIRIVITGKDFVPTRAAILRFYDQELFEFTQPE